MKRKLCKRCQTKKAVTKFREDVYSPNGYFTYCRECEKEYQIEYRAKMKRSVKSYDLVLIKNKKCSCCNELKKKEEFNLHRRTKSGLDSQCRECINLRQKAEKKDKDYVHYRLTHPDQWKAYINAYKHRYTADPMNSKRQTLAAALWKLIKEGIVKKPKAGCKCMECEQKCAKPPKACFTDKYVRSLFKQRNIDKSRMIKNIIWLCNDCIYKKRK